jgi:hypothetical protein
VIGLVEHPHLAPVQNAAFTPQGFQLTNITFPSSMQFVEMYGYTQAGLPSGKRLQVQETLYTTISRRLSTGIRTTTRRRPRSRSTWMLLIPTIMKARRRR